MILGIEKNFYVKVYAKPENCKDMKNKRIASHTQKAAYCKGQFANTEESLTYVISLKYLNLQTRSEPFLHSSLHYQPSFREQERLPLP